MIKGVDGVPPSGNKLQQCSLLARLSTNDKDSVRNLFFFSPFDYANSET